MSDAKDIVAESSTPLQKHRAKYAQALHIGFFVFAAITGLILMLPFFVGAVEIYAFTTAAALICWWICLFVKPRNSWLLGLEFVLLLLVGHRVFLMLYAFAGWSISGFAP